MKSKYYLFTICFRRPAGRGISLKLFSSSQILSHALYSCVDGALLYNLLADLGSLFKRSSLNGQDDLAVKSLYCANLTVCVWPLQPKMEGENWFLKIVQGPSHVHHGMHVPALTFTCAPWDVCICTDFHMCPVGYIHRSWPSHMHHEMHVPSLTFTCALWVTCTGTDLHKSTMGCMYFYWPSHVQHGIHIPALIYFSHIQ